MRRYPRAEASKQAMPVELALEAKWTTPDVGVAKPPSPFTQDKRTLLSRDGQNTYLLRTVHKWEVRGAENRATETRVPQPRIDQEPAPGRSELFPIPQVSKLDPALELCLALGFPVRPMELLSAFLRACSLRITNVTRKSLRNYLVFDNHQGSNSLGSILQDHFPPTLIYYDYRPID